VLDEIKATPEVLYGAGIAFVIVVLLTPAVGGMARMLGVVDEPPGLVGPPPIYELHSLSSMPGI